MENTLTITKDQVNQIIEQAIAGSPREICGILGGRERLVEKVYPTVNVDESNITYKIDPKEQFMIMRNLREEGLELVGIYHSHPATVAYPSATDCRLAFYPEAHYVIVSLADTEPILKAFRIIDGKITESVLKIV